MKMPSVKVISFILIAIVWYFYFYHFNQWDSPLDIFNTSKWLGFSNNKGDWGTFGDFVGGVLNPILTFITIVMLINSLKLQRDANEQLIKGERRQEKDVLLKRFEDSFYNLISSERDEFSCFTISLNSKEYRSSAAVSELEEVIWAYINKQIDEKGRCEIEDVRDYINQIDEDSSMAIFSMVRCVYVVFRVVKEKCPKEHQEYYLDIFMNMLPVKLINLVALMSVYMEWHNVNYISDGGKGFADNGAVKKYIEGWKNFHQ